jgi:PAS domain S-box-containing protein
LDKTAIVIADATGTIRFWSQGAESVFGHLSQDAVGRSLDLIVPEQFRASHWAGFRRAVAAGSATIEGESSVFPVLEAGGRIRDVSGKLSLLRDGGGSILGCMVIFGQDQRPAGR